MPQYNQIKQISIAVLASSNFVFSQPGVLTVGKTKTIRGFNPKENTKRVLLSKTFLMGHPFFWEIPNKMGSIIKFTLLP